MRSASLGSVCLGAIAVAVATGPAVAQTIYPLDRAEFLTGARFDLKVEFPGAPPADGMRVTINGQEVTRDVEYAQQRLRLRLLEPHEPLQRMAAEVVGGELSPQLFGLEAELLAGRFPELLALTWLDARDQVVSAHAAVQAPALLNRSAGQPVLDVDTEGALGVARTTLQPHFSRPLGGPGPDSRLLLLLPLTHFGSFQGTLMVEYSLEMLLRLGVHCLRYPRCCMGSTWHYRQIYCSPPSPERFTALSTWRMFGRFHRSST